jgi:hypothetical protein
MRLVPNTGLAKSVAAMMLGNGFASVISCSQLFEIDVKYATFLLGYRGYYFLSHFEISWAYESHFKQGIDGVFDSAPGGQMFQCRLGERSLNRVRLHILPS